MTRYGADAPFSRRDDNAMACVHRGKLAQDFIPPSLPRSVFLCVHRARYIFPAARASRSWNRFLVNDFFAPSIPSPFLADRPLLNLRFLQHGACDSRPRGEDVKGTKVFSFHRKTRCTYPPPAQLFTPLSHGVTLKLVEPKRSIVSLLPADNGS